MSALYLFGYGAFLSKPRHGSLRALKIAGKAILRSANARHLQHTRISVGHSLCSAPLHAIASLQVFLEKLNASNPQWRGWKHCLEAVTRLAVMMAASDLKNYLSLP